LVIWSRYTATGAVPTGLVVRKFLLKITRVIGMGQWKVHSMHFAVVTIATVLRIMDAHALVTPG